MKMISKMAALLMVFITTVAMAQERVDYQREGDLTKVTYYYADGEEVRETGYFKDGKAHGRWVEYTRAGDVRIEAYYHQGEKEGTWFVWEGDGKTLFELTYEDNYLVKTHQWAIQKRDFLAETH